MKIKRKQRGRELFSKNEKFMSFFVRILKVLPYSMKLYLYNFFQNKKGLTGLGIRYILLKSIAKKVGKNVSIHPSVYIFKPNNLTIGDNVSIHPLSYIDATGGVTIEDNVSIAHNVTILSTTHKFSNTDKPIKDQGIILGYTEIQNDVWIGAKATILYNTTIKSGTIIGANSLVTKDSKENTIIGGVPARLIKYR